MTHNDPASQPLDQLDPHHELQKHHHVIMRTSTLVGVLVALLILTVLTVGQAQAEAFAAAQFGVHLPQIFNVVVVMAIAVVKASLVALYFMQLKYDNPLNAIVLLFSLFAVGLFLTFTMIDLGNRGIVSPIKAPEIQAGGMGIVVEGRVNTENKSVVEAARERRIALIRDRAARGEIELDGMSPEEYYSKVDKPRIKHDKHHSPALTVSSPNRSVPPRPVGPALFAPAAAGDAHGHGHH
jgi:cytochrome c oxidase subunit IV